MKYILFCLPLFLHISCISTSIVQNEISWIDLGSISYGDDPSQYIEITAPKYSSQNLDVIFFIKGIRNEMVDPTFIENYRGEFIIAKLDYRNPMPDNLETVGMEELLSDVHNGLTALKSHVEMIGINTNKIIIIGSSFGGTLSLMYSYTSHEMSPIPIAFCVSLAGLTDMTDSMNIQLTGWPNNPIARTWLRISPTLPKTGITTNDITRLGYAETALEVLRRYSPIYYVNESVPPTIIIHDTNDKIVPFSNSISLSHTLNSHGVPNIFIQSTANQGHLLGSNVRNTSGLVFTPIGNRSTENTVRRVTRRIHPLLEEQLLISIDQYISIFCR